MMKTMKAMELEINPDQNRLDEEWVNQPRLRFRYGVELADARRELSLAKASMEVVEGELKLAIRKSPSRYGLDKVTDDAIKAAVLVREEYKDAKSVVIERQHDVDVLDAAVSSIDHRKKALEDLVQLHLSGYFAEPRHPKGSDDDERSARKEIVRNRGRNR